MLFENVCPIEAKSRKTVVEKAVPAVIRPAGNFFAVQHNCARNPGGKSVNHLE
jgi:hypothetical protein